MSDIACRRCVVSGRVQGVFYRATIARIAKANGLTGWARNLPDGRVEVLLCGERDAVQLVATALWEGSRMSKVTAVECEPAEVDTPAGFVTG